MARPSKLTPEQWRTVEVRFSEGETASALAREFGVDEAAIRRKFRRETPKVRAVAGKLATAQIALAELPRHQQTIAIGLAAQLQRMSEGVAQAACSGADTAALTAASANKQARKFADAMAAAGDDADPMDHQEKLQAISALTKISNDAMQPALALLKINQDAVNGMSKEAEKPIPEGLAHFYGDDD